MKEFINKWYHSYPTWSLLAYYSLKQTLQVGGKIYSRKWTQTSTWDTIRTEANIPEHKHLNEYCSPQSNSLGNLHAQPNNSIIVLKPLLLEFPSENME